MDPWGGSASIPTEGPAAVSQPHLGPDPGPNFRAATDELSTERADTPAGRSILPGESS